MASERQAALDRPLMKQLIEDEIVALRWTPTRRQLADPLTWRPSKSLECFVSSRRKATRSRKSAKLGSEGANAKGAKNR